MAFYLQFINIFWLQLNPALQPWLSILSMGYNSIVVIIVINFFLKLKNYCSNQTSVLTDQNLVSEKNILLELGYKLICFTMKNPEHEF